MNSLAAHDYDHLEIAMILRQPELTLHDHFKIGTSLIALEEYAEAAEHLQVAWRGGFFEAGDLLSTSLLTSENFKDLERELIWADSRGVKVPTLRLLATLRCNMGDQIEARALLEQAITVGDSKAHSVLGGLLFELDELELAEQAFEVAHGLGDWRGTQGLIRLATTRKEQRAVRLAMSLVADGYDQALMDLAHACRACGQLDLAEAALRDAVDFEFQGSHEELIGVLLEVGQVAEARKELSERANIYEPQELARLEQLVGDEEGKANSDLH